MSFNDLNDQFQALADKYGLTPGFQGDYDLRSIFGDLVDDQSFVRDRVSYYDLINLFQRSLNELVIFISHFILVGTTDHGYLQSDL